jgi:hypothetical protein
MDVLNLCLKTPNLGIILYFLIFVIIIPIILYSNSTDIIKYYLPMLVVIAHLLSKVGDSYIFGNLYNLKPDNTASKVSTHIINIVALIGVLWQIKNYNVKNMILFGISLLIIVFVLSRNVLDYMLDYIDTKITKQYKYNWPLLIVGLVYIIILLVLQYGMVIISSKLIIDDNTSYSMLDNSNNKTTKFLKKMSLNNINSLNNRLRK